MHTRNKNPDGTFSYTLVAGFREVETISGYQTAQEADRAAEVAERCLMSCGYSPELYKEMYTFDRMAELSDEELLAELYKVE